MKRSDQQHWAVLPGEPTRMAARFLAEQHITRIVLPREEFSQVLLAGMAETILSIQ